MAEKIMKEKKVLWIPDEDKIRNSHLFAFRQWLRTHHGLAFPDYEALWDWSVTQPSAFWDSVVQFFDVHFATPYSNVMSDDPMPDTKWFEGSTLNYAEHIIRNIHEDKVMIYFRHESGRSKDISGLEMRREIIRIQQFMLSLGVQPGDRVVGFLPNIPEATYAFLAATSLGAVWSCCSPDFGVNSVVDRFAQIEPVLFIASDGYWYNDKLHDKTEDVRSIQQALPTLKGTLLIDYIHAVKSDIPSTSMAELPYHDEAGIQFSYVPFEHPLWILYSSGTTGVPKAITHSHGGCLTEHLKYLAFHNDAKEDEVFFWFTTTGWMMWNFLHGSMLMGSAILLYDGSPAYPTMDHLWQIAEETKMAHFGTSAPFLIACMKQNSKPGTKFNLNSLRSIGSTGSPLPPEAFDWVYAGIHHDIWLCSMSGGTDVCTAFVGGVIEKPVIRGEIQARALGCSLFAWDDEGHPVTDQVGEMVITQPMPSMPVYFWNDPQKTKYKASYFEDYPGVWRHGDWVEISGQGGVTILGRSDATLNRHGIRIGTAEIYRVLHDISGIADGLIVNIELPGGRHYMPLFVKMDAEVALTEEIKESVRIALRNACSPRHVPDDIIEVPDIPYTISGKKMESPIKKILMGMDTSRTLHRDAMRNPESLAFFEHFVIPDKT